MKSLISSLVLSLLLIPMTSLADGHGGKGKNFDQKKAMMVENLTKRIANLQEAKSCAEAASEKGSLKACRQALQEKMKGLKMERMDRKIERMQKRKEKMKSK